jgi:hypothetical protein
MLGTIIIISIAILLIGFNLYIRVSTLKYIKTLMDKGIRFGWEQLISSTEMARRSRGKLSK